MEKLSETRLSKILPENLLRDEKIKALSTALDNMLIELTAATRETIHLPRLDELSGSILDLLAYQLHVDFWEPLFLDDETKRNLIRESIATHRQFGTKAALEKVNAAFNREIKIEEWFEYGGEPYWFRLRTKPFKSAGDLQSWLRMIHHVKSVRDQPEIIFEVKKEMSAYVGIVRWKHGRVRRRIDPIRATQKETSLYAGVGRWAHGRKNRPMTDEYEVGRVTTTLIDGARTLEISSTEVIISYGEEIEVIPLGNLFGDVLRMRFAFPSGERILTIPNPREDLTAAEVQAVADYVTENEIILDTAGEPTSELKRATLITTTTQVLF